MTSRKWIGTVLITLFVVAILAAGGAALYRFGYTRGALAASSGEGFMFHGFDDMPFMDGHMGEGYMFHDFNDMPFQGNRRGGLPQGFQGRFDTPDRGFFPRAVPFGRDLATHSFYSPFTILLRVLFLGLMVWVLFKLVELFRGGKSWQLSFNSQVEPEPEPEVKPKSRNTKK
jgi:hypothetical protein